MAKIHTPAGDAPVIPVLMLMIGGYLVWFGVHFFKSDQKWPTDPIKQILQGKPLTTASFSEEGQRQASLTAYVQSFTGAGTSSAASAGVNAAASGGLGASIAGDALKYVGASYVYGGNASRVGDWDCSSFVSYVLGHDLGLPLPGGKWGDPGMPPNSHGPTTLTYALYGTSVNRQQVQAGDLAVWNTHMGICLDGTNLISAQDERDGTGKSTIDGTSQSIGETVQFRRVTG